MRKPPHSSQPPSAVAEHSRLVQRLRRRYGDWLAHLPPGAPVADSMALGYARLREHAARLARHLAATGDALADIAFTLQAGREALAEDSRCTLWITGGDGPLLAPLVRELVADSSLVVECDPGLALEALAALRPVPDR